MYLYYRDVDQNKHPNKEKILLHYTQLMIIS